MLSACFLLYPCYYTSSVPILPANFLISSVTLLIPIVSLTYDNILESKASFGSCALNSNKSLLVKGLYFPSDLVISSKLRALRLPSSVFYESILPPFVITNSSKASLFIACVLAAS